MAERDVQRAFHYKDTGAMWVEGTLVRNII
jgi:hypothetical protein